MINKKILNIIIIIFIYTTIISGCGGGVSPVVTPATPTQTSVPAPTPTSVPVSLAGVKTWAIELQNIEQSGAVNTLADSRYDLLILDPTRTSWATGNQNFDTKGMVQSLKATYGGNGTDRKIVLAYINIGEAENWQWYWKWSREWNTGEPKPSDWPDYIVVPDPGGWKGNFPVAFWDPRWKDIIIYGQNQNSDPYGDYTSALDEVIKDGFDGILMNWVEGYADPSISARASQEGKDPAVEMVNFIREIRTYALARNPGFIIIQQNASELGVTRPELLNYINALSQQGIWYDAKSGFADWNDPNGYDIPKDKDVTDYYINNLNVYQNAGLPVFDLEYAVNFAGTAYSNAKQHGYIPYCSRISLSYLTTTLPPDYRPIR